MAAVREENDYCMRHLDGPLALGAAVWDRLVEASGAPPCARAGFLDALHASGAASPATGWSPHYLGVMRGGELVAAAPLYRKTHSWGEYVFDQAWADAYARHGLDYYPKWLVALPFTPVPGPRLLAVDTAARAALARALVERAADSGLGSLHVLFPTPEEAELLAGQGLMLRPGIQFHWFNRGWTSFEDFLGALAQPKRKKIRAERRKVAAAGVECEVRAGSAIRTADWEVFHRCYEATYAQRGLRAYLPLEFFLRLAAALPEAPVMSLARRDGRTIAAALALRDGARLYGRHWGALETVDCLHFELAYYRFIEFAIEQRLAVFEGGAQGEHKLARGFEPVTTVSAHWIAHPGFAAAIARHLEREQAGLALWNEELLAHRALREP